LSSSFTMYDRGYRYCSRWGKTYLTQPEYCPLCGRKLRIKGRNNKKGEDVERIEIEGV